MNNASKPLSVLVALGAAVAMPIAFAQTAPAPTVQDDATQTAPPQAAQPQPQPETAPQAQPKQVTWADLDSDKDGNLSKAETATVPELSKIFDQADANKDGKLSAEEYKAFAMKQQGGDAGGAGGH